MEKFINSIPTILGWVCLITFAALLAWIIVKSSVKKKPTRPLSAEEMWNTQIELLKGIDYHLLKTIKLTQKLNPHALASFIEELRKNQAYLILITTFITDNRDKNNGTINWMEVHNYTVYLTMNLFMDGEYNPNSDYHKIKHLIHNQLKQQNQAE